MNYHKIEKTSIANGSGIRVVLWCAGCRVHCYNCHNPQTWDVNSGKLFDELAKQELFEALSKPYIKGITFSGGHPLEDENVKEVYSLIVEIRNQLPNKDIWLYTGFTWNQIFYPVVTDNLDIERDIVLDLRKKIVEMCDVVVDGPYIESQRDITLAFRGSKNQRLIDVKKTLEQKEIALLDE